MSPSASTHTITLVPDTDRVITAAEILASMCDGIAHELRTAATDLKRLAAEQNQEATS